MDTSLNRRAIPNVFHAHTQFYRNVGPGNIWEIREAVEGTLVDLLRSAGAITPKSVVPRGNWLWSLKWAVAMLDISRCVGSEAVRVLR